MDPNEAKKEPEGGRLKGDHTLHADRCLEFVDEDVKDDPGLGLKSPPIIPRLVVPDSNQNAPQSQAPLRAVSLATIGRELRQQRNEGTAFPLQNGFVFDGTTLAQEPLLVR